MPAPRRAGRHARLKVAATAAHTTMSKPRPAPQQHWKAYGSMARKADDHETCMHGASLGKNKKKKKKTKKKKTKKKQTKKKKKKKKKQDEYGPQLM